MYKIAISQQALNRFGIQNVCSLVGHESLEKNMLYPLNQKGSLVRLRKEDGILTIAIKGKKSDNGTLRLEMEFDISRSAATVLRPPYSSVLEKTRFTIPYQPMPSGPRYALQVDVFEGRNRGLVTCDIELQPTQSLPTRLPDWIGRDITNDKSVRPRALETLPFSQFPISKRILYYGPVHEVGKRYL